MYRIFPISCSRHFLYGIPFSKVIQSHLEVLGFKIVACCCFIARPEKNSSEKRSDEKIAWHVVVSLRGLKKSFSPEKRRDDETIAE